MGRCMIFPRMKEKSGRYSQLKCEVFGAEVLRDYQTGVFDIVEELRKLIFCAEPSGRSPEMELVEAEEFASRHLIGLVGDAPVCVGRYHVVNTDAFIDRFGVLSTHRLLGIGKKCFEALVDDIRKCSGAAVTRIIMKLPNSPANENLARKLCSSLNASLLEATSPETIFVSLNSA
jgi:hypothetical protein